MTLETKSETFSYPEAVHTGRHWYCTHAFTHTHSIKRNKKKGEKEENKRAILNEKYATGPVFVCSRSSESSELDATTTIASEYFIVVPKLN